MLHEKFVALNLRLVRWLGLSPRQCDLSRVVSSQSAARLRLKAPTLLICYHARVLTGRHSALYFVIHSHYKAAQMIAATAPMSIRLDTQVRAKLGAIALRQKRSAHALAAEAIHKLIADEERLFAWNQSSAAALTHFDETGLHATHAEVTRWMDAMFTDKELPAPLCHN